MSIRYIFGDDCNDAPCSSLFCSLAYVISLESRSFNFRVFIHVYSINPETNRRIRYKKLISRMLKTFSEEILFRVELIASLFLI